MRALELFLTGLIDYAGLFPPAKLDLNTAFSNYIEYLGGKDSYILSRFICPSGKLKEFYETKGELKEKFDNVDTDKWISFSVLPVGGNNHKEFVSSFTEDLKTCDNFINYASEKIVIDVFEVKLPEELLTKHGLNPLKNFYSEITVMLNDTGFYNSRIFFELPSGKIDIAEIVAGSMAENNQKLTNLGLKFRTGGISADAFPTVEDTAKIIKYCRDFKIPFKATAGLHHPVRHFDKSVNTFMHGFFNIFGAGILAHKHSLSLKEITEIVKDENKESFKFTEDLFLWRDIETDCDSLAKAREELMLSFGSCSFDEPRQDIKEMGYEI